MSYKLLIIKKILETDEETDKKVLALLQCEEKSVPEEEIEEAIISMEDRKFVRKEVALDANIDTGNEQIKAITQDVSLCGAFVRTEVTIPQGKDVAVRLITPDGEDFEFISEVIRKEPSGIGIVIKNISSFQQDRFQKFVKDL